MKFYTYIVVALCFASIANALQDGSEGVEAAGAPEPYAYGYEAQDHAAAEEKTPDGKVTGYYFLRDVDGRQRRVEYYADETGFHAKVQTNELGQKTSNPADVQVLASPANPEQLQVYYQQQQQPQLVGTNQQVLLQPNQQQVAYISQPYYSSSSPQYGYSQNSLYGYYPSYGYGYSTNGYQYPNNYGLLSGLYGVSAGNVYGGYNYHTPSAYYSSRSSNSVRPVSLAQVSTLDRRVGNQLSSVYTLPYSSGSYYRSYALQPNTVYGYATQSVPSVESVSGSYRPIVIQKREAGESDKPAKTPSKNSA